MNIKILLVSFLFYSSTPLFAQFQFQLMDDFLQIGAGNYFIHLDKEGEVNKMIQSVIKSHHSPNQDLIFNKGKNLFFAAYYVNPSDVRFMCVIHALKGRKGNDLYLLYCVNALTHHFEYIEGKDLYELYDPQKNSSTVLTSFGSTLVSTP
jgi:hypothetical protein